MSVRILVDMNLSPQWVTFLRENNVMAMHWSMVGEHTAKDSFIMEWAREKGYVVFTHDLDFGTLLALTKAESPSIIQIRTQNILPENLGASLLSVINRYGNAIEKGALIVMDDGANRVRILPLERPEY
jgi:predicted nuclease of predicted toxin-antitoxin system